MWKNKQNEMIWHSLQTVLAKAAHFSCISYQNIGERLTFFLDLIAFFLLDYKWIDKPHSLAVATLLPWSDGPG